MLSLAVLLTFLALSGAQTPIPYRPPGEPVYSVSYMWQNSNVHSKISYKLLNRADTLRLKHR